MNFDRLQIDRRTLLKFLGAGAASQILPGCSDDTITPEQKLVFDSNGKRVLPWSNWSGNQSCQPQERLVPRNIEQLIDMVSDTEGRIRCVGSGHSFSPLVPTNETLMSLARFRGVKHIDQTTQQVDIGVGSRLSTLGQPLFENGLGLINMPDIDTQTLGGAIATSTHGTGMDLGSISSTATQLKIVTASGELVECSKEQHADLFNAARNHIGALGVVIEARIQTRDSYYLKESIFMLELEDGLAQIDQLKKNHRHFEMYALPHADYILAITLDEISEQEALAEQQKADNGDAYETFRTIADVIDWLPFMRRFIINSAAGSVKPESKYGRSYDIFSNLRDIRFNEMEYSVPAEVGPKCLKEILDTIKSKDIDVIFPLEYRYIKADDVWISPFYQRDSCSISVHNFHDKDYKSYFAEIEPIFWKYSGRPHWGKIHTLNYQQLKNTFPKLEEFAALRREMDPAGKFLNPFLEKALGIG